MSKGADACINNWINWLDKIEEAIYFIRGEVDDCDTEGSLGEQDIRVDQFYDSVEIIIRGLRLALAALYASED